MHVYYVTMFQIHLLNHVPKIGNFGENIHVFLRHFYVLKKWNCFEGWIAAGLLLEAYYYLILKVIIIARHKKRGTTESIVHMNPNMLLFI